MLVEIENASRFLLAGLASLTLLGLFLYISANNLFTTVKSLVLSLKAVIALILLLMLKEANVSASMLIFFVLLSGLFGLVVILASFIMNRINHEKGDLDLDKNSELKN
ncbi:MAG: hypothetical protein M9962_02105 [Oligoflexia bacterium]|nr:hypothetical protein [Oligoflexia bacterium]